MGAVPATLAEHEGVRERCRTRGDVHGCTTGEVETTHLGDPAGRVPSPAGYSVVDESCPDEHEYDTGEHTAALGDSTDGKSDAVSLCVSKITSQ